MRRVLLIAAVMAACTVTGTASAATTHHSSRVTIAFASGPPPAFIGFVHSPQLRCYKSRTVKLLLGPAGSQEVVGQDLTDGSGSWEVGVAPDFKAGDYQAKATRKVFRRHGHRHVCDPAKSRVLVMN